MIHILKIKKKNIFCQNLFSNKNMIYKFDTWIKLIWTMKHFRKCKMKYCIINTVWNSNICELNRIFWFYWLHIVGYTRKAKSEKWKAKGVEGCRSCSAFVLASSAHFIRNQISVCFKQPRSLKSPAMAKFSWCIV